MSEGYTKVTTYLFEAAGEWWINQEVRLQHGRGMGARFRADCPDYTTLLGEVRKQPLLPFFDEKVGPGDDDMLPCVCTD